MPTTALLRMASFSVSSRSIRFSWWLAAFRDVAQGAAEQEAVFRFDAAQADVHGDFAAVFSARRDVQAPAHGAAGR
jgi:hypothetical protein